MVGRPLVSDEAAIAAGFRGPEAARRRAVLRETLEVFGRADPPDLYHRQASANLNRWRSQSPDPPDALHLKVIRGDWGEVTQALTETYGRCFAVLNMANAYVPGGAYVEGAVAQEENIFRRTDCHFRVTEAEYDRSLDQYTPEMTRLISGGDGLVYLDVDQPRVCIRGPEDPSEPDLGYRWLSDFEVFPFYELRGAAQDLRGGRSFDEDDARLRIASQLETLRSRGVRYAVLGASGCGAFRNPAERVAAIYRSEVDKRRRDFDVIAFAIFDAGYGPSNFEPFAEAMG